MIGATQTTQSVIQRRCTIYTMELASLTSGLAFIGMVLAVGVVVLELRGVLHSKSKPYLIGLGLGSSFLMLRAFTLHEPSFIALEAVKVIAAVSALVFPRNEHLAELAEELAVM
jgi:hypothetical protein